MPCGWWCVFDGTAGAVFVAFVGVFAILLVMFLLVLFGAVTLNQGGKGGPQG